MAIKTIIAKRPAEAQKKCLVLAYKYNDIYYAINTAHFKDFSYKCLLIIESTNLKSSDFPFQSLFNEIIIIKYSPDLSGILKAVYSIRRIFKQDKSSFDYLFTSNIRLTLTQYLIHRVNCKVIMVEDGTMNYKKEIYVRNSTKKKMLFSLLGINDSITKSKIEYSYLTVPHEAQYSYGTRKELKLKVRPKEADEIIQLLEGKKIFIGGSYYLYDHISLEQYNSIVNSICEQNAIDYYIPHHYKSADEKIAATEINLNKYKLTFEMIIPFFNTLQIFSIGSSVLFSAKTLNKNIHIS